MIHSRSSLWPKSTSTLLISLCFPCLLTHSSPQAAHHATKAERGGKLVAARGSSSGGAALSSAASLGAEQPTPCLPLFPSNPLSSAHRQLSVFTELLNANRYVVIDFLPLWHSGFASLWLRFNRHCASHLTINLLKQFTRIVCTLYLQVPVSDIWIGIYCNNDDARIRINCFKNPQHFSANLLLPAYETLFKLSINLCWQSF